MPSGISSPSANKSRAHRLAIVSGFFRRIHRCIGTPKQLTAVQAMLPAADAMPMLADKFPVGIEQLARGVGQAGHRDY